MPGPVDLQVPAMSAPGAPTEQTPGWTDRVKQIVESAEASMSGVDRSDEVLELEAEDRRREQLRRSGQEPDDPGSPEPPINEQTSYLSDNGATAQPSTSSDVPALARLPRILEMVAAQVKRRGLVGEKRLAQTLYLVMTSRLLDQQVSAGVKGHSASGKSRTVEIVSKFFPREAYLEFTGMSEKALVYSSEQFKNRTLIVYELTALREGVADDMTSYFVRTLLSEGCLKYDVTVRGEGGFTTKRIVKQGPTNLIFTTTQTQVHAENETRILSLTTDDSREQTRQVMLSMADETNGSSSDLAEWHALQRWLAKAEHRVTIPYGPLLAELVPPEAVRLRRDFSSLLALIRSHAVLHQVTRERDSDGRIVATLDDYIVVRGLVADVISEGVGAAVSPTVKTTVEAVEALTRNGEAVMAKAVADRLKIDKSNATRRLRKAADDGYVVNLEDKIGKPARWITGEPLPTSADLLPDAAQLATPDA